MARWVKSTGAGNKVHFLLDISDRIFFPLFTFLLLPHRCPSEGMLSNCFYWQILKSGEISQIACIWIANCVLPLILHHTLETTLLRLCQGLGNNSFLYVSLSHYNYFKTWLYWTYVHYKLRGMSFFFQFCVPQFQKQIETLVHGE